MENKAVITTKFILEKNSPILSIFRDEDGDLQFFGNESNVSESDARLVSLDEILRLDSSIANILGISSCMKAWRETAQEEWNTSV